MKKVRLIERLQVIRAKILNSRMPMNEAEDIAVLITGLISDELRNEAADIYDASSQ
jgi:hypothetical protein